MPLKKVYYKKTMIMISIIIPTYNAEKYIEACLESCLNQTCSDFEIVIINDGSMDRTSNIIATYAERDKRIKIVNKRNEGLVKARIVGLQNSKGEYIFFLDSDDIITVNAIEIVNSEAQKSGCDIIIGNIASILESGKRINNSSNKLLFNESEDCLICSILSKSILPSLCGRLIRRTLFDGITFPEGYTIGEDVITNIEFIQMHRPTVSIIDNVIYNYIQHPGSMVNVNTEANANRRMKYIKRVEEYINLEKSSIQQISCAAKFFLEEYFAFLRDGGSYKTNRELNYKINNIYLNNKWAINHLPIWRIMMLKTYRLNPILGRLYRFVFIKTRLIFRK